MTTVANDVEREVKLALDLGADLPDLRGVVAASVRQPEQQLCASYFDTADLRLWASGITLRHRTGEGEPRWTLKLPRPSSGHALTRTELEWVDLGGEAEGRIPAGALQAVAAVVRRASLQKVAELHTERIRFLLEEDGVVWAELASDVVTVVGGRADGQRFRQLELEFVSGATGRDVDGRAVVKVLRRAGARPDPHPKLEKVLGPPQTRRPLDRKSTAEEVVCQAISAGLERLLDHDCRIRVAGRGVGSGEVDPGAVDSGAVDPEDVHQARVATRRLRSDLKTLEPLIDPLWLGHVREDLRWVGAALGEVRDTDVLAMSLSEAGAGDPLIEMLRAERATAAKALAAVLQEPRYMDLLDRLHAASARPPITDRPLAGRKARRVLPGLVNRRWKQLSRDVRKGGRHPADEQLHQLRKRSKQLRYASELATPVMGKAAKRTAKASESLQTVLGEHHDAVVASDWLARAGHPGDVERAREVVSLIKVEDDRRRRLDRKWRPLYKKLAKPSRRAWMKTGG